jgi:hypothetical protein
MRFRVCSRSSSIGTCCMDNMRPGGAILGDQWNPQKGRARRVLWLFWGFLCGSPRLCQLRTEGLVPVSKYWTYRWHAGDMGPVSLAHYFNGCVGRETGAGPMDRSAGLRGGVESTFSQEQWICLTLLGRRERLPCTGTTHRKRTPSVRGLAWEAYVSCWFGFPL